MKAQPPPSSGPSQRRTLADLLAADFATLAALLVAVYLHAALSAGYLLLPVEGIAGALAVLSVASVVYGVYYAWREYPQHHRAIAFVVGITLVTLLAHAYIIGNPASGYIGDESFYVPEGMGVLSGQHCSFGGGAPTNCHLEHPFLVPGLIAAGMAVFGAQNAVGWRFFPVLLGTFSLPLLFGIAWKTSGSKRLAYLSTLLLGLDVMFFAQSGSAFLDIPETFFGLAAFLAYFVGLRWWKLDKYFFAGLFLGLAGLSKETAVFMVMALLTYILLFGEGGRGEKVYSLLKVVVVVGLVFAAGMQAYDSTLATPTVPTFVQQTSYILSYGSSLIAGRLACQPTIGYFCKYPGLPGGPPIIPTDWLVFYSPVAYFRVGVTVNPGNLSFTGVAYYGVTNLIETWATYVWLPLLGYALYRYFRTRQPAAEGPGTPSRGADPHHVDGETRFVAFAFIAFLWGYVPYLLLFLGERVTYPFYLVPALPAMAMGTAYWISRNWFPKWLIAVYLFIVFLFFFVYFPDKSFLPDWLRAVIGH
ncbi:MAG: glycosyltransferase family 39 protein [Thaumarchaeota archaeon]|nr:glycosyltransferase family 39 protein [Nitrososphaerota archaeon]